MISEADIAFARSFLDWMRGNTIAVTMSAVDLRRLCDAIVREGEKQQADLAAARDPQIEALQESGR